MMFFKDLYLIGRMNLFLIGLVSLFCFSHVAQAAGMKYSQVRVSISSKEDIRSLQQAGLYFDHLRYNGDSFDVVLDEQGIELLRGIGRPYQILIEDMAADYLRNRAVPAAKLAALSQTVNEEFPVQGLRLGSMGGMYTLDEAVTALDSMRLVYPHLISAKQSIGSSYEGRPLWMVKISDHPDADEQEPEILYTALHHASEPMGLMALLYFMYYLLEQYGQDPEVTFLVDNRELYFVPAVNPDGYAYAEELNPEGGQGWRFNRRTTEDNDFGVDLNRNYGFQWQGDLLETPYWGSAPFSEPETQAIRDFCISREFRLALNYHDFSEKFLLHPWGNISIGVHTPDSTTYRELGAKMTEPNAYPYGPVVQVLYDAPGNHDDWMYGEQETKNKIMAMSPEIGAGFWPRPDSIFVFAHRMLHMNLVLAGGRIVNPPTDVRGHSDLATPTSVSLTWNDPSTYGIIEEALTNFTIEIIRDGLPVATVQRGTESYLDETLNQGQFYQYELLTKDIHDQVSIPMDFFIYASGVSSAPILSTVVETTGNEDPAIGPSLNEPSGLSVNGAGHVYIADRGNHQIYEVDRVTGIITTVAGTGERGFTGDGMSAVSARLASPSGVYVDGGGHIYIADEANHRIRKVDRVIGIITTVAGTGERGFAGDGMSAVNARLASPSGISVDDGGHIYIADEANHRIRKVDRVTGIITTVAGSGGGFSGDGGPATSAKLWTPSGVSVDGAGHVYIADRGNNRIRKIDRETGIITTVAGSGKRGFAGDGMSAVSAHLASPSGVYVDGGGHIYIADEANHRIRKVDRVTGIITTVVGNGERGFAGDGRPATMGSLDSPQGVWVVSSEDVYIADTGNRRIRRVAIPEAATVVEQPENSILPVEFILSQNYPNPFNSSTVIRFDLAKSEKVKLAVYNLTGQKIETLVKEVRQAGSYTVHWNGQDDSGRQMASGIYLYRLQAGIQIKTRKLVLLR